jgi:multisubunit Na+/H+ antiporter MnhG subunit
VNATCRTTPHHKLAPQSSRTRCTAAYGYGQQSQQPTKNNGFAIASIILGVVGCVASLVGFGLFTIPVMAVGLALGIVAFKDATNERRSAKVMAIVGIALSVLALVLTVAWILFLIDSGEIP